ncbi:MAG: phosphoglucosamine mutase [Frankiales bacterium]|jgi:phosphoglucosamine mutase|nr:phosphoglucosamine mutase [Frankiales bacterium]
MARLFGTDGVRGVANGDVLTAELALQVGLAAAQVLGGRTAVIGRDTRPSGPMLEAAAAAGFAAAGLDVLLLGVVPTPTVAHLCASGAADIGLMISASHNPMPDNGLKLFAAGGLKLSDAQEDVVEAALGTTGSRPTGTAVGTVSAADPALVGAYADHLLSTLEAAPTGLKIVVDCAQGSASAVAPEVYRRAGAEVVAVFSDGDGAHINDGCGATHLEALQAAVLEHGADLGLAHDGDADRCLAVDATGAVVDGDKVLAICALGLKARGALAHDTVVATVMSNLGFVHAMRDSGIEVVQTAVGDRYVLEAMRDGGYSLGGEQSGHLVLGDHATTGDGLLTGLQVLGRMAATGSSLAELAAVVQTLPQVLVNVRAERTRAQAPDVLDAVAAEEAALAGAGRVLLRPSGTEPVVRVMVEAPTQEQADEVAQRLASVVGRG